MALSDIFGGLLGGGSDPYDIYGDLFSEKQREALRARQMGEGLLKMAGAFGEAAQPSRLPTSFGAALGKAAGALAGSGDEGAKTAISGMKVAEDVQASRANRAIQAKYRQILEAAIARSGIDPKSPQAQQIIQQTLANPAAAPNLQPGGALATPPAGPSPMPAGGVPGAYGAAGEYGAGQELPPVPGAPLQTTGLLGPPAGAPDQVVGPDGQPLQGAGVFPAMMASLTGGMPGGRPPFRLASSTPTGGVTPGAGGARDDPRGVVPYIRERAAALGINPDVAERVARSEGVGSFQSNVIQKGGRREPSYGAFQLYTGGGMGNDFQRDTGLDPADPKNEKATIDYALQKARTGGWSPFHGAKGAGISARAGIPGGEDYVIPSGRGVPRSALTNVADTGGAAPGGGVIPGLNMTPEQLGLLNAYGQLGGLKSPFDSLLETYYKSPGYLESAEAAKERGKDPFVRGQARYSSDLTLGREMITRGIVLNPDGSLSVRPGAEALSAAENAKFTNDIKEYNFYAQQVKEHGGIPDPFDTWDRARKKAGATTINTAEGFGAAQTKARVAVDQKIATEVAEQAIAGRRLLPVLDELAYLADKTPEGWPGTLAPTIGRAMAGLGMSVPPGMSNAEAFQALAQRLVPIVREPGATSQGEMAIYLQAGPSLAGTADGRKKLIAMNKAMVERSQEIARAYRDNIGSPQLYEKLAALDKPLFTDEQRAAMNAATAPAAAPAATAPTAPSGSRPLPGGGAEAPLPPLIGTIRKGYEFLGGDPSSSSSWRKVP